MDAVQWLSIPGAKKKKTIFVFSTHKKGEGDRSPRSACPSSQLTNA